MYSADTFTFARLAMTVQPSPARTVYFDAHDAPPEPVPVTTDRPQIDPGEDWQPPVIELRRRGDSGKGGTAKAGEAGA